MAALARGGGGDGLDLGDVDVNRDQPGWSAAGDHEPKILLKVGCPNYLDVFRQQDRKFPWSVLSGCDF